MKLLPVITVLVLAACTDVPSSGTEPEPGAAPAAPPHEVVLTPRPLPVTSRTMAVRGEFASLTLDRVDRLELADGHLVARGSASTVRVAAPESADLSRAVGRWALVTDANTDAGKLLVFTHEESLDEVEVTLPATEGPIRFGVFAGRNAGEVMVLAWGQESRTYWGYVLMERKMPAE